MIFDDTRQTYGSVIGARLGDALASAQAALLRCEFVGAEPVSMKIVALAEHPGDDAPGFLKRLRKAADNERRWQDAQAGKIGGVGGMLDMARFPEARPLVDDAKSKLGLALITSSADDRREGSTVLLAHNRLVATLRLALARGRVSVVPMHETRVGEALAALQNRPPAPVQERVPVTDMDADGDLGLALALAVWAAAHRRPLGPQELAPTTIDAAHRAYADRNVRTI